MREAGWRDDASAGAGGQERGAIEEARRALRQYRVMLTEQARLDKRIRRIALAGGPREIRAAAVQETRGKQTAAIETDKRLERMAQLRERRGALREAMARIDDILDEMQEQEDAALVGMLRQYYCTMASMQRLIQESGYSERHFYRKLQQAVAIFAQWWEDSGNG